jgi:hypothetical protein
MVYFALLFSLEVQSLSFANVQLPALSMLIAFIKALLTVFTTLSVEKNSGIDDSSAWTFSAASLRTTVAWSGANADVTDGYINTSELPPLVYFVHYIVCPKI